MEVKLQKNSYGYILSPGNNHLAIELALKKRNVWTPLASEKDLLSVCLLWKQLNYSPKVYADFQQLLKSYPNRHVLLNHFQNNYNITTKSGLIKTLRYYYSHELAMIDKNAHVFDTIPTSFVVHAHKDDIQYRDFIEKKNFTKQKVPQKHCEYNVWFVKPESDNQGKGIILSNNFKEIESFLISKSINSGWIIQKAIEKPLLYYGRKFDIRVWVLLTSQFQIYYFNRPYMRTSSSMYTCTSLNSQIHLTNNCQQKHFSEYSKFQDGNTIPAKQTLISYIQTLPNSVGKSEEIVNSIFQKIKQLIVETLMSARKYFVRSTKKKQFELFGYDFLIDEDYRTWLLQINNNPYLGVPNAFIKELLPQMIDEMFQIVLDPLFPPENYNQLTQRKFQLLYKDSSSFRISPIRVSSLSNQGRQMPKRQKSFSIHKSIYSTQKAGTRILDLYNIGKDQKTTKPIYSTPTQTIKYLLDNYCFNDLQPFMIPANLILNSNSLSDDLYLETNLKKLKLLCETRIARILLQPKIYQLCANIIGQQKYNQKIKAIIIAGLTNACKTFKSKIFVIKNIVPLLCQNLRSYKKQIDEQYLESIIKLTVCLGGYLDRTIFIPGQTRENQFVRQLFIKSNTFKLLLYLKKQFPNCCANQVGNFIQNISNKDWELFYEISQNKNKRAYSPKVNTAPENQDEMIIINTSAIIEQRPKMLTLRQNAEIKNFRTRRLSNKKQ